MSGAVVCSAYLAIPKSARHQAKHVLGLQIAMNNAPVKSDQRVRDVAENRFRVVRFLAVMTLQVIVQRHLSPRPDGMLKFPAKGGP